MSASSSQDMPFQSTHSLRSATGTSRQYSYVRSGFNPRTPCGVRPHGPHVVGQPGGFNPRTPCGVRRSIWGHHVNSMEFQSTHSLRSATWPWRGSGDKCAVSIHALLAECDHQCVFFFSVYILFQSTHSLRSATFVADNPMRTLEPVSIHALLAECDLQKWHDNPPMVRFNPRTPCGVRLEPRPMPKVNLGFNPRTPCGVRHAGFKRVADMRWFQSTHSLRSATDKARRWIQAQMVSIHALLAECDNENCKIKNQDSRFNPRTPCGVRRMPLLLS